MRVLVADDSFLSRRLISQALTELGITDMRLCTDGKEALSAIRMEEFDLILLDWHMPGADGIDLLRELRSRGKKAPVIMVTTDTEKKNIVTAIQSGANNYVAKPFKVEALVEKIRQTLKATHTPGVPAPATAAAAPATEPAAPAQAEPPK